MKPPRWAGPPGPAVTPHAPSGGARRGAPPPAPPPTRPATNTPHHPPPKRPPPRTTKRGARPPRAAPPVGGFQPGALPPGGDPRCRHGADPPRQFQIRRPRPPVRPDRLAERVRRDQRPDDALVGDHARGADPALQRPQLGAGPRT